MSFLKLTSIARQRSESLVHSEALEELLLADARHRGLTHENMQPDAARLRERAWETVTAADLKSYRGARANDLQAEADTRTPSLVRALQKIQSKTKSRRRDRERA